VKRDPAAFAYALKALGNSFLNPVEMNFLYLSRKNQTKSDLEKNLNLP
jgi:hypothetical protein